MQDRTSTRLHTLQSLRAVAASIVVILHASAITNSGLDRFASNHFGIGVDLFFVISGFIMVYASRTLFGSVTGWKVFLTHRLIRIIPLYWFALSLRVVALSLISSIKEKTFPSIAAIIASFFFIPFDTYHYGHQYPFPILDLGWTLNYEFFFYISFSLFLFMPPLYAVLACSAFLTLGVLLTSLYTMPLPIGFWFRPIVLEFVLGMWIGLAYISNVRIRYIAGVFLFLAGLLAFFSVNLSWLSDTKGPGNYSFGRFILYGGIAAAWITAATLCDVFDPYRSDILVKMGDSSYCLYLLHPFFFLVFKILYSKFDIAGHEMTATITMVVTAIIMAHAFHVAVERRVTARLRRWSERLLPRRSPTR